MFLTLLSVYVGIILGTFVTTVILILFGLNWGTLPRLYLKVVQKIQNLFPPIYPDDVAPWPSIIEKNFQSTLIRHKENSSATFQFLNDGQDPWNISQDALRSGVESIIQDELSPTFDMAPSYTENLILLRPKCTWSLPLVALFYLTVAFRFLFLLPVRLCLFATSFAYVALTVLATFVKDFSDKEKTSVAIIYCRLFCASIGLVANYHEKVNRPTRPGIAVSNHLSPNDIQILFSDVDHGAEYGFLVTGQKHTGIIWVIQRLVERMCPSMWLERKNNNERRSFTDSVLDIAKTSGPILVFPEGYCSNNTQVLQFRKALFEDGVVIHPMAIKQNARYGDNFWSEDLFYKYIGRCLVNWAVVYDVTYLPSMHRLAGEDASQFAKRAQIRIAEVASVPPGNFDGSLWYKKTEQQRLKLLQQEVCASSLKQNYLLEMLPGPCLKKDIVIAKQEDTKETISRDPSLQLIMDPGLGAAEDLVDAVFDYLPFLLLSVENDADEREVSEQTIEDRELSQHMEIDNGDAILMQMQQTVQ